MNVNPLMTVWLISCVITYSGLTGANTYSSFRHEKKKHGASELARLYGKEDSLASYKLDALRLLSLEKKKKNKSSDSKTTTEVTDIDAYVASSSTTTVKNKKYSKTTSQTTEDDDDDEDSSSTSSSSSTTSKTKKGNKKAKTQSTSSQQGSDSSDNKNSNGNDNNIASSGGSNKWKKIQKFFFGPPNWSFNKSYRVYGPTTNEAKSKEELRPMELAQHQKEDRYDQATFRDSTYLHSITISTNDQYKDKLLLKEEIIKKNMPGGGNIDSKEQMNDVDTSKHQSNKIEKIPPRKFYEEGNLLSTNQEDRHDIISSVRLMDKTDERTTMQLDIEETTLSRPLFLKQEEITLRKELSESDKMSSAGRKLPPQNLPNELEKEHTVMQENHHTNGVNYNYANVPSSNQIESIEKNNYNIKETLYTDLSQTGNTMSIHEAIDERQLQLKPEVITDNIIEKYEVSMVREDPKLSFKPEATIELEPPPNQTNMENEDLSYKQNYRMTADKWKHIFNFNEPDYEQLKNLYSNIINHVTEKDLITSRIENTFDKIIKSKLYNIDYQSNMTDSSNEFLKAFGNFIRKGIPEILAHHTVEKLFKTSQPPMCNLDKDNTSDQTEKQYFFVNKETKSTTEQINNPTNVQVNEQKYSTPTISTMLFGKPTCDSLQIMQPKLVTKYDTLQQKHGQSTFTTPSSTIIKQYSIAMWPKYTDKSEYNVDYFNNVQSSVHPASPTLLLDVSSSSNYQYENQTRATDSSSTETTNRYQNTYESMESPKESGMFETLVTIPLIFTKKDLEMKSSFPANEVTTTKHMGDHSVLNLTLHPMIFNHLWGIQSYLNSSSYETSSTTVSVFPDDKTAFDYQHEFNADHHFQITTPQPFFSDTIGSEWAPFSIPNLGNEFDIISPSTLEINEVNQENIKQIKDFTNFNDPMTGILKKSGMSMIEKHKIRNFTAVPKYIPFSTEINRRNLFLLNHPLEKPESMKKIQKYISYEKELVNDPIWNEIMDQTILRKEKLGPHIKDLSKSEKLTDGNQIYQNIRKPSLLEEKIRGNNLINLSFPKGKVTNNGRDDVAEFLVEPFFRNLQKMELMATKVDGMNFDKIEVVKNGIDEITTQVMNNELKNRNKLKFWSNLNGPSSSESEELKELTNKYQQSNAEVDDEFNKIAASWPLLEFQRKSVSKENENKIDSLSIHNNEMLTQQPSSSFLNDNKPTTSLNGWYVRNEQNEKLLASEKSFDKQLSMSSPRPISFQKEINFNHLRNNIGFLNNVMNQSLPEITNNSDMNRDEFSAIQMSAIKMIKNKPEMSVPPLYNPFKNILDQNSNNTEINHEMSQMFMKMQDFANKLGMKKILLKRGVTYPQNDPFESNRSWGNKCPVIPSYRTDINPFYANLTHNNIKTFITDKKCNNVINNIGHQIFDEWKYNMQSVIDKQNEKRNLSIYDNDVQKDSDKLLSYVTNNNLQHLKIQHKPLENFLGNQIHQSLINSDDNDKQFFSNNNNMLKRNVIGNKKMKSRELEFILDRNLPRLPLNKRQFITYMMTGLKNSGNPIIVDDERHSQLSKANLQNLIDRNVKKDKVVELTNKRPRKKQWHTNAFA